MRILGAARAAMLGLVVALAMTAAPAAAGERDAPVLTPELRRVLQAAGAVAARSDPAASAMAYEAAASHADFALLGAPDRAGLLLHAARFAADAGDHARAGRLARASVEADDSDVLAWYLLGQVEAIQGRDEAAALAFARLARGWPDVVDALPVDMVNRVLRDLGLASGANREMLEALHAAGWTTGGVVPSHAWAQLALMRAAQGDLEGARTALADAESSAVAVRVRSDRRFDALVARDDPRFDPLRAVEVEISRLRATALASPTTLHPLRQLGYSLLLAGRPHEVLALVDEVLADPSRFDDAGDLHWMLNHRAVALRRLDRTAEALAALTEAAALDESGHPNVSQSLNLGALLADMGRPGDALAAVARVDGMSGYGLLVQSLTRLRAYRQLGLDDDAAVWFERIRDGRDDGPSIWLEALLLLGREDEAADWLASLLVDPDRRESALDWCQDYLGSEPLPGRVPRFEARRALLARADVRSAVDAVGRCGAPGLYRPVGID